MSLDNTLTWIERLIAFAVLLQTVEMLQLRPQFADDGIWSWQLLKKDYISLPFQKFFGWILSYRIFNWILQLRLLGALFLMLTPENGFAILPIFFLFFSTWLIGLRWRGTFNGGSDYMTFIVLLALSVASLGHGPDRLGWACVWYIAIQTILSFFIAGIVKLRNADWRNGTALNDILKNTNYFVPASAKKLAPGKWLGRSSCWFIIVFECSFPLALVSKTAAGIYIATALIFHLVNFYLFGLNRFLFAWAAAYPAVYFCSRAPVF